MSGPTLMLGNLIITCLQDISVQCTDEKNKAKNICVSLLENRGKKSSQKRNIHNVILDNVFLFLKNIRKYVHKQCTTFH